MSLAYYNEIDPYAAQWLRNLIEAGHIAPGIVDTRSIEDVEPEFLQNFTQCHFFAGIGVWSLALRRAGWPDDRPVWTGSCPCQPFSAAGKGAGFDDERHLWPAFDYLIQQCRPAVVFGEQVASKDGLAWLDLVRTDLEAKGYAFGAADLCAAGIGAPHIRQRLYWVGNNNNNNARLEGLGRGHQAEGGRVGAVRPVAEAGQLSGLGNANRERRDRKHAFIQWEDFGRTKQDLLEIARDGEISRRPGPTNGFWCDADWLACRDGKWRAVEPGTFPLVNGAAPRVGKLRAFGNAVVAQVAETFVRSYLDLDQSAANPYP